MNNGKKFLRLTLLRINNDNNLITEKLRKFKIKFRLSFSSILHNLTDNNEPISV